LPKSVTIRTGQRLGVPRGGIIPISIVSNVAISATITTEPMAVSKTAWRVSRPAASARRGADGGRTSSAADSRNNANTCRK
jgi:hypothetical protein